jgi:serine/threonine-protein kinase
MLEPGDIVDAYEVESLIGEGGMALVYRVRHQPSGVHHALKVLHVRVPTIRLRLLREARLQAALCHPNLVAVSDLIEVHRTPGLVMDFVEGPTLEGVLLEGPLDLTKANQVFCGVAEGVSAAHQAEFVHRDLKPANVLLSRQGYGVVPKVCDFGVAKVLGTGARDGIKTVSGVGVGTPGYMAPEQIVDSATVDARADVFALGSIAYEMLVGSMAFGGEFPVDIFNATCAGRYKPLPDVIPPEVGEVVACALSVEASRRYPSAAEMLKAWHLATVGLPDPVWPTRWFKT